MALDPELALKNSKQYRTTEKHMRDKIYNWVVDLYTRKGKEFKSSDEFVFAGFTYTVVDYLGYVLLFTILWWLVGFMQKSQGDMHALYFLLIFIIVRLGMLLSAVRHGNRLKQ